MIFSVSILRKVGKTTIVTHGRLRVKNISHNYGFTCQSFCLFSHLSIFNNGAVIELSVDTASFLQLRQNSSY